MRRPFPKLRRTRSLVTATVVVIAAIMVPGSASADLQSDIQNDFRGFLDVGAPRYL
ncbi:hypothetical protein [Nocardia brevicatena]|uniref:hypothetical protein n=1 Tax=Nocardia brevicatena TaxID=37327 RepID=UPI0002E60F06